MPGPFPGMDPFLEDFWGDVHASLTLYTRNALQSQLPPDLCARVEEYLGIATVGEDERHIQPDVRVAERPQPPARGRDDAGGTAVAEAVAASPRVFIPLLTIEPPTLRRVRVIDKQSGRVVTAIEYLSPFNKRGAGRRAFRRKQSQLREAGVNLVEIDLLRRGRWTVSVPEYEVPPHVAYPYRVCVLRADEEKPAEMYETDLRQPLPNIRVPLRPDDKDVLLNLQRLLEMAWQDGGYDAILRRQEDLPPLRKEDAQWVAGRLSTPTDS